MEEENGIDIILKYFPDLSQEQKEQFLALKALYVDWNSKINVISRKDIDALYEKHVLHSLAIAKFIQFKPGTRVLDLGTGGGFPGMPMAILFPEVDFTLIDGTAKKIKVAEAVAEGIQLQNTDFVVGRAEYLKEKFHFITARAVANADQLISWTRDYVDMEEEFNQKINGYLFLKGGDLRMETKGIKAIDGRLHVEEVMLSSYFEEPFFESKKLLYIF